MSDKEVIKKDKGPKKYLLPLICAALLGGGGIWGISANRSADKPPEKTDNSSFFAEEDSDESSWFVPDKKESTSKKAKEPAEKEKAKVDVADSVLDRFNVINRPDQESKPKTTLTSNELANVVAMVNQEEVEKKKEVKKDKDKPSVDVEGPVLPTPPEPIKPNPEPEPEPVEPVQPKPELPWIGPTVNVVTAKAVLPVGGMFNPFDYMSVSYGSDQNARITHTTIDTSVPGTQTLTMNVVDSKGYSASAEMTVVVNSRPVLSVTSETIELQLGQIVVLRDYATAIDHEDGDLTDAITMDGKVDTNVEGSYDVTYSIVDRYGYSAKKTIRFNVTNEAPVIHAKDVTHEINQPFNPLEGVTVTDREDGEIELTEENIIENNVDSQVEGSYTVTIGNVKDSHGKAAETVTYTVNVVNEAPIVVVAPLELEEGSLFDKTAYRSSIVITDREDDKAGIELTVDISDESLSQVDTSIPGTYEILITVTDSMGKTTTVTGIVTVTAKVTLPEEPEEFPSDEEPGEEAPIEEPSEVEGPPTETPGLVGDEPLPEELVEEASVPTDGEEIVTITPLVEEVTDTAFA